jgi:hypothetical protein
MQNMLAQLFSRRRRLTPRDPKVVSDPRSGAPAKRRPDPMPRMRWY